MRRLIIPAGAQFGRLVVLGEAPPYVDPSGRKIRMLLVRCTEAGCDRGPFPARMGHLRSGATASCGCLQRETTSKLRTTHGGSRKGDPLYGIWGGINDRCNNLRCRIYPRYGGRGIKMWPSWRSQKHGGTSSTPFQNFQAYIFQALGARPAHNCSIDRLDNSRGYEPGNLRWATAAEQGGSRLGGLPGRRNNVMLTHPDGRRFTEAEWAKITGIQRQTLAARRKAGWSDAKTLTKATRRRK